MQASWRGLGGVLECLGTVLNSCYAYSHTHRDMRGCHLCVHTLPWPRKHGHINGTLPERLLLMFAYTWSPARLPPMCAYFALAPHMCPFCCVALSCVAERETSASPRHTVVLSALRCVVLRSVALRYIEGRTSASHRHTVVLSAQTLLCCLALC